ncbi:MAG TPA: carboxypeptidase regulatory-like domain-containing protein [Vicinamibacterales bacterium]|nr:carboxypeptidase regulatory-like domain-containing protein [Vicinamibacterales bacterium]
MIRCLVASVLCVAWTVDVPGATPAAGTVVSGTVSGSDQGFLTGASVVIDGSGHRATTTDADGRFTFADVPRGRHRIVVSAEGYLPLDRPLDVGEASVSIDVLLLRLPGL